MDSARTARYLLAVVTIAVAISHGRAAPAFGLSISIQKKPAESASSSLLEKLPLPQLPKITMTFNSEETSSHQPSTTDSADCESSLDNENEELQSEPTVDKKPSGQDSHHSSENASQMTSPRPKLEMTTDDRSVSNVGNEPCGKGEVEVEGKKCQQTREDPN